MRFRRYGRAGVLVEVHTGEEVALLCAAVAAADFDASARPGWRSVLVESDLAPEELEQRVRALPLRDVAAVDGTEVVVEVVYDGPDLPAVAEATGLTVDEVVRRHSGGVYVVRCLGFARGFPYLEGLDSTLWLPRRDEPRTRVAQGSVAIAAEQTGIYPQPSPGGWHLLGRTDMPLFDVSRRPPALLQPGDRVRFAQVQA